MMETADGKTGPETVSNSTSYFYVYVVVSLIMLIITVLWHVPGWWIRSNYESTRNFDPVQTSTPLRCPPSQVHANSSNASTSTLNTSYLSVSPAHNLSQYGPQLGLNIPDFWPKNVAGYFKTIEILFAEWGVNSESLKYTTLVTALSKNQSYLAKVADVLQHLDNNCPYTQLKKGLLERYSTDLSPSPLQIIHQCSRGSDTISEFLVRLKTNLGQHYDPQSSLLTDALKHKLLESVDPQTRLALYQYESTCNLSELARHADCLQTRLRRLSADCNPTTAKPVPGPSSQTLINESLESRLDSLQNRLEHVTKNTMSNSLNFGGREPNRPGFSSVRSNKNPPSGGPHNPPTQSSFVSTPIGNANSVPCYYHKTFGNKAWKCKGFPCPFQDQSHRPLPYSHSPPATQMHRLQQRPPPNDTANSSLFFVNDSLSGAQFLVDTGAACSIFPLSWANPSAIQHASLPPLHSLGFGTVEVSGKIFTKIDLGFSRLLDFDFLVSDLEYGILGADFLSFHKLIVDLSSRRLTELVEIERCSLTPGDDIKDDFAICSDDKSNSEMLQALRHQYPEVFEPSIRTRGTKHSVVASVETTTCYPISTTPRRLSPEKYRALKEEIKRLCDQGILEPSQSAWSSPVVMVKKKKGGWRLCADFTNLNKILATRKYALPDVNDFTSLAHGCQIFSSIDISDAYYNIKVKPQDKHKLTITTPLGNYCYNFLPMGLASSSTYFQQLMNEVLSGIPQTFCYLDDIIIMSSSSLEHQQTLHQVFTRLQEHGLVINSDKCFLGVKSLSFLGYHVSSEGLSPLPAKVEAINAFTLPRTPRQLRSYLGMYQYYAKFVPRCSHFLQPLHTFVASAPKNRPLQWSEDLETSFESSKTALKEATILAFPDPDAKTELVVDASGSCIGAVLQQSKEGKIFPIAFWSKGLSEAQKSWSAFERELYASYMSIKHFQYFLDAKDFTLKTDHKPIVTKFHSNTLAASPRQQRYFDYIAQMTNQVEHVSGKSNVADIFSRISQPLINAILPNEPHLDYLRIALAQRNDSFLEQLRKGDKCITTSLKPIQVPLAEHGISLLCDNSHPALRPIIPESMAFTVFRQYHSWSHPGAKTGIKLIGKRFVWHNMKRDICKWTKECQGCARAKILRHNVAPIDVVTPSPSGKFTDVYVDITGPLGVACNGYNYLLVIIDRFSRFMNAVPLTNITAEACVDAFIRNWVSLFGCPVNIYTDRGTQFTSSLWADMCNHLGSKLHHSTAYHPQAQGLVERLNRTLKTCIKSHNDPNHWYDQLPWALMALRNSPKEDLADFSPTDLVFGQPIRMPGEFFNVYESDTSVDTNTFMNKFGNFNHLMSYMQPRRTTRSSYVDKVLFQPETTHVYVRVDSHRPPLCPPYKGPYRILRRYDKYFEIDLRTHMDRVSIDRLKAAHLSVSTLNEDLIATRHAANTHEPTHLSFEHDNISVNAQTDHLNSTVSTPPTLSPPPHSSQTVFTRKGRRTHMPSRFRDYDTNF